MQRIFSSTTLKSKTAGVISISPPDSPYFETRRIRFAAINTSWADPTALKCKIGSVDVGGSPQLAISSVPSERTPNIYTDDIHDVNWAISSTPALARQLTIDVFNQNEFDVQLFVCAEGHKLGSLPDLVDDAAGRRPIGQVPPNTFLLPSAEITISSGKSAILEFTPVTSPYFKPLNLRFHGRKGDSLEVPLIFIDGTCGATLLTGALSPNLAKIFTGAISVEPDKFREIGTLTSIFVDETGWADVNGWPTFSTESLGRRMRLIVYNPWPFEIKASAVIKGLCVDSVSGNG